MAADKIAIANKALNILGAKNITSFTQTGSREAEIINEVYDDILDEVLSEHPWSFAQKRKALSYVVPDDTSRTIDDTENTPVTITGATQANPVVITAAAHGFSDGDWVKISSVSGMTELNNNFYIVANSTTNTFELTDTDGDNVDGTGFTAYTSGGSIQKAFDLPAMSTETVVVYIKPTDYVKITGKSIEDATIRLENNRIISDTLSLSILYTFLVTDTTVYFPKFIQALAERLAAEISFPIMNSVSKARELRELYNEITLPGAISVDSTQSTPTEAAQDEWLDARLTASNSFVTFGETWHTV